MITFKEYREKTKTTSRFLLRICGVIFSVCFCVIYLLTESSSSPFLKNLLYCAICILLGNLFAVFIWLMTIYTYFKITKRAYKIIENLPKDIIESYKIFLLTENLNNKNAYPESKVVVQKDNFKFLLRSNSSQMFCTLLSDPSGIWTMKYKLDCKYRKEHIELTGFGFRETSKLKTWRNITKSDFDKRIQRLIEITQTEIPYYSERLSQ